MKLSELSELFERALAVDPGDARQAFVDQACANQDDRKRLSSLLAAHNQTHTMMDDTDSPAQIARSLEDDFEFDSPVREGDEIDNYKLLEKIGQGGMGYVFMADQLRPIQRRVAVKVMKTIDSSRQVLNRFEAERAALSRLDHPNITQILDAGATQSGAPYFVMELVRGDNLTDYCDRHKLSIDKRVHLVQCVCMAVHHAHQKGILHRDIKPSNIMVTLRDGKAVPKVIDFGIAKAIDRPLVEGTMFTRYGDMVGTPQYMSPEQAEKSGLDLDVRTDIYSLGAVLFELLTGTPPLEQARLENKGVLGVLEAVRDNETENPSTRVTRVMATDETVAGARSTDRGHLAKLLRGELDWIVMKSLSRSRSARYDSAAAMARDLRAYLDGGTVDAAAPSFLYQTRKLFQRHRSIGLGIAAGAVLMLVVTLVSLAWAISNKKLQRLATQRTTELSQINVRLNEQQSALTNTLERALQAEQKALMLVNEKKEQAAIERAMAKLLLDDVLPRIRSRPDLENRFSVLRRSKIRHHSMVASVPESLEANLQRDLYWGPEDEGSESSPKTLHLRDYFFGTDLRADDLRLGVSFEGHDLFERLGIALPPTDSLSQRLRDIIGSQFSNNFARLIVEEFRKEFGEDHQKVAEVLIAVSRAGLPNQDPELDLVEGRLREAMAILGKQPGPSQAPSLVSARLLLAEVLLRSDRRSNATDQIELARRDHETYQANFDEEQRAFFEREFKRVTNLRTRRGDR